jgi:hypothetical protein
MAALLSFMNLKFRNEWYRGMDHVFRLPAIKIKAESVNME